jgi:IclR family pca regulon transcriptional regulator
MSPRAEKTDAAREATIADAPRDREFVHGLQRGFSVLLAFDGSRSLTTNQVAALTGLSRAVAWRYLFTLEQLGYVCQTDVGFTLTPRVLDLGFAALADLTLADVARPVMSRVVATLHESCSLGVLQGHDVLYVERVTANRLMTTRLAVGSRLPAHSTSMGRVLLAHLPPDRLASYFETANLTALTDQTVTNLATLRKLLDEVRRRGWASNDGEAESGVRAVSVPVMDRSGVVVAALNSAAHASRVTMRELIGTHLPVLLEAAREISAALGAPATAALPPAEGPASRTKRRAG